MAWSRVQSAGNHGFSASSFGVAYSTANLSSGTKLIALVSVVFTTTSSVKDGAGNSFTKILAVDFDGSAANGELSLWAIDTPAGDVGTKPTITATFAASSGGQGLVIQEVSGLATGSTVAAMIDGTPGSNSGIGGTGSLASPAYSSSLANEYLVACYGDDGASGANTWTAPSGYTADPASINSVAFGGNDALSYKNSTGGSEAGGYSLTGGNSDDWAQILCAFKLGAGGASPAGTVQPRATVPPSRRKPGRGQWQRITGQAFVKVPAPRQQPRPAPRRTLARAVWRGITGAAHVKVPAPRQQPRPAPRRTLSRACIQFRPVRTANASAAPAVSGTVQPRATVPVPRRRPGRAVVLFRPAATANAVPPPPGSVQSRATLVTARRRPARALIPAQPAQPAPLIPAVTEGGAVYYPYHHRGRGRTR